MLETQYEFVISPGVERLFLKAQADLTWHGQLSSRFGVAIPTADWWNLLALSVLTNQLPQLGGRCAAVVVTFPQANFGAPSLGWAKCACCGC